jgi:hypothetical protein
MVIAAEPLRLENDKLALRFNAASGMLTAIENKLTGESYSVSGAAQTTWSDGVPMTIESSFERPGGFYGYWTLYFYVPRGTKIVGGFSGGAGTLRNGGGSVAHTFTDKPGYFSIAVPPGEDGKLWKFEQCAGDKMLMTVPPFLARSASELLLPREVVEKDAQP